MKVTTAKKLVKSWDITKTISLIIILIAIVCAILYVIVSEFICDTLVMTCITAMIIMIIIWSMVGSWWEGVVNLANSEPDPNLDLTKETTTK